MSNFLMRTSFRGSYPRLSARFVHGKFEQSATATIFDKVKGDFAAGEVAECDRTLSGCVHSALKRYFKQLGQRHSMAEINPTGWNYVTYERICALLSKSLGSPNEMREFRLNLLSTEYLRVRGLRNDDLELLIKDVDHFLHKIEKLPKNRHIAERIQDELLKIEKFSTDQNYYKKLCDSVELELRSYVDELFQLHSMKKPEWPSFSYKRLCHLLSKLFHNEDEAREFRQGLLHAKRLQDLICYGNKIDYDTAELVEQDVESFLRKIKALPKDRETAERLDKEIFQPAPLSVDEMIYEAKAALSDYDIEGCCEMLHKAIKLAMMTYVDRLFSLHSMDKINWMVWDYIKFERLCNLLTRCCSGDKLYFTFLWSSIGRNIEECESENMLKLYVEAAEKLISEISKLPTDHEQLTKIHAGITLFLKNK